MTALRLTLAALTLLSSTGCGVLVHTPDPAPIAWPLVEGQANGPSVLVRCETLETHPPLTPDRGLDDLSQLPGLAEGSGVFSEVAYQPDFVGFKAPADFTLDFALSNDVEAEWYSALGLLPGLPLVGHDLYTLECVVRDDAREVLGTVVVQRRKTLAAWLPLLPFNVILFAIPGGTELWVDEHERMVDGMLKEAFGEAHRVLALQRR